ncbi:hypothetical protein CFN79_14965 [Chromobacterium vaccinii]|uniref:helix-turn-helix domain-containing protein n=1 Tax=Chromobacterium vaccinii TaxID=1108595 RepID=UPI000CE988AE|nr:hypothetical protein CFN79_14965 [Chromobacterium vaccinii]
MPSETFHSRLRSAIEDRGTTITAVAAHLGVSRHTVTRWCKSQMPDDDQINRLAAYLGISPHALHSGTEISPEHMAACHRLFALATGLSTRDVEAMIHLAESILATKV